MVDSRVMALFKMVTDITEEMDNGNFFLGILIDLSKTFDTVDDTILFFLNASLWNKGRHTPIAYQLYI